MPSFSAPKSPKLMEKFQRSACSLYLQSALFSQRQILSLCHFLKLSGNHKCLCSPNRFHGYKTSKWNSQAMRCFSGEDMLTTQFKTFTHRKSKMDCVYMPGSKTTPVQQKYKTTALCKKETEISQSSWEVKDQTHQKFKTPRLLWNPIEDRFLQCNLEKILPQFFCLSRWKMQNIFI